MTSKQIRGFAISGGWVLVIVTPLLAIVLWLAITYANDQRDHALRSAQTAQHESLVKGCARGNLLRVRLNNAIRIEHDFLVTARVARLAAVKTANDQADRALNAGAAADYKRYIARLAPLPLVNCAKAYP